MKNEVLEHIVHRTAVLAATKLESPTRFKDEIREGICQALASERAAIVAWLREGPCTFDLTDRVATHIARVIEDGTYESFTQEFPAATNTGEDNDQG